MDAPGSLSRVDEGLRRQVVWMSEESATSATERVEGRRHDVSDRGRAHEEIHEREERLKAVLDTAGDAIITIGKEGSIESFNHAAEKIFGYPAWEAIGSNISILMPSPYREEHDGYLRRYLETGEARVIGTTREVVGRRRDGSAFPIELSVAEVEDPVSFMAIVRDISERRYLEERLLHASEDEQRRIARELHDGLGGQMTGIALLARSLEKRLAEDAPALAESAAELVAEVRNAQRDLRRISRGLSPVEDVPEGLVNALRRLVAQCSATTGLHCIFESQDGVILDDVQLATQLFRVAQEAVSNAVRHAQASTIVVSLIGAGESLRLRIRDDGVGIRASPHGHEGTGLSNMQSRVARVGGNLRIESEDGEGTLVSCTVPR